MKKTADLLLDARWVIPVVPDEQILEYHSVVIRQGKIIAILPSHQAAETFIADEHIELTSHALIPGLINLHTHAAMSLLRGIADDTSLMTWLNQYIWPAEQKHLSPAFVRDGTLLACAEMIKAGITCFNDQYFYPQAAAEAACSMGLRSNIGIVLLEFPTPYASGSEAYFENGLSCRDFWKDETLLSFSFAPHAPYTVSDRTLERTAMLAEQLDLGIHMHIHETQDEIDNSLKEHRVRPLARLQSLGILTQRLIAAHAVHLDNNEIDILAQQGCHIAHCPSSNLKLGSGIAPLSQIIQAGINFGFGTDGAASNNRLDILTEMRTGSLLAKGISRCAQIMPAHLALRQATLGAAQALGLEDKIGSIEIGKAADLVAIHFKNLESIPCYNPVSHLVYTIGRESISHAWVDGQNLLKDGILTKCQESDLIKVAKSWQNELASH